MATSSSHLNRKTVLESLLQAIICTIISRRIYMATYGMPLGLDGMFFHFMNMTKKNGGYPVSTPFYGKGSSEIPMLSDSIKERGTKFQQWPVTDHTQITTEALTDMRHSERANVAFHDGHVKSMNKNEVKELGFEKVSQNFIIVTL